MSLTCLRPFLPFLLLLATQLAWIARPVDFDETNFLVLARGAAADPWRPHAIEINWTGKTARAFDVLSNPPGVAWWLAPVVEAPIALQRVWMLPWFLLSIWGARLLGRRFGDGDGAALVLLASPIALLSAVSLLPDAPLHACTLAGVGGTVRAIDERRPAIGWALLAGCAALFRYSGVTLIPLLGLYALLQRRAPWVALWAALPTALLAAHDLHVYGAWHFAAMAKFQSISPGVANWFHKAVSALAMLGGACALPLFGWGVPAWLGAAIGAASGWPFGWLGMVFAAAGGASLATALAPSHRDRATRLWLAAWAGGGFVFLLGLRFMATRYWIPFLPGVLLALPLGRFRRAWLAASAALALALGFDGFAQARGVARLADEVARYGTGRFTGHWGFQWAMEQHGWKALEAHERVAPGTLVAKPRQAWPQPVDLACSEVVWRGVAEAIPWLPRSYTEQGRANLHSNAIAGPPPRRTVLPFGFARDPYEEVVLCRERRPLPRPPGLIE